MPSYWEGYIVLRHWQVENLFSSHWSAQTDSIFTGNTCLHGILKSTSANDSLSMSVQWDYPYFCCVTRDAGLSGRLSVIMPTLYHQANLTGAFCEERKGFLLLQHISVFPFLTSFYLLHRRRGTYFPSKMVHPNYSMFLPITFLRF